MDPCYPRPLSTESSEGDSSLMAIPLPLDHADAFSVYPSWLPQFSRDGQVVQDHLLLTQVCMGPQNQS